jgi:hypothetical protein
MIAEATPEATDSAIEHAAAEDEETACRGAGRRRDREPVEVPAGPSRRNPGQA